MGGKGDADGKRRTGALAMTRTSPLRPFQQHPGRRPRPDPASPRKGTHPKTSSTSPSFGLGNQGSNPDPGKRHWERISARAEPCRSWDVPRALCIPLYIYIYVYLSVYSCMKLKWPQVPPPAPQLRSTAPALASRFSRCSQLQTSWRWAFAGVSV